MFLRALVMLCCVLFLATFLTALAADPDAESVRRPELDPPVFVATDAKLPPPEKLAGLNGTDAAPSVEWTLHKTSDGTHPDGNEQQMVWMMNRARQHPEAEGIWLAHLRQSNIQSVMNYFGVQRDILMDEFAVLPITPPAAFDRRLYLAADSHSDYLVSIDGQNHVGQIARIGDEGFHYSSVRGSVYSYCDDAVYAHAGFNVDWGGSDGTGMQPGRGHRAGLMGNYANVGIACVVETNRSTEVGDLVTTINYCNAQTSYQDHYNVFIVGTVWEDLNDNAMYDPDEGLGGVQVMPDAGTFFAVTGDAGGYAIPVTAGSYTLTFSGGDLSSPVIKTVTIGTTSVLVEWIDRSLPAQLPATPAWYPDGTVVFTLTGQKKGIGYRLCSCADLVAAPWAWTGFLPLGYGDTLTYTANFINTGDDQRFLGLQGWSY